MASGHVNRTFKTEQSKRQFRNWLSGVQHTEQSLGLLQVERIAAAGLASSAPAIPENGLCDAS
jgi:hypothetical protein